MRHQLIHRNGFTLPEALFVLMIIVVFLILFLPSLATKSCAPMTEDQSQIRQIQQAFVVFSNEDPQGRYPTPGLIRRLDWDPQDGAGPRQTPGRGEPDDTQNTTANLYSALIAQNYFGTKVIVGTTETSPNVFMKGDYDYEAYNPIPPGVTYWDDTFTADLSTESNASYAHPPLAGVRLELQWKNTTSSDIVCIGNRGPRDGAMPGTPTYKRSNTLGFHGDEDQWIGNVCFADNHVEFCESIIHEPTGDNLFGSPTNVDGAVDLDATDFLLAFTRSMRVGNDGVAYPELQYD